MASGYHDNETLYKPRNFKRNKVLIAKPDGWLPGQYHGLHYGHPYPYGLLENHQVKVTIENGDLQPIKKSPAPPKKVAKAKAKKAKLVIRPKISISPSFDLFLKSELDTQR